ncbi:MAG: V-type ATP synthase subunit I [Euryarchaeota archaeon]|nr:V-type ATP synthase subunit I [Euryarchaeota archaeon]
MLQKMKRIMVVGPKRDFHSVVDLLYDAGTVHLEDVLDRVSSGELSLEKWNEKIGEEISNLGVKIGGIFLTLPKIKDDREKQAQLYENLYWQDHGKIIARTDYVIKELESTIRDLSTRKSDLDYTITALNRYEKTIEKIQPLENQLPVLEGYEATVILIQKEYEDVLKLIRTELLRITGNRAELVSAEMDEETIAAIMVFNKRYSDEVHSFIFSKNVNEVRLPDEFMGKPFDEVLELIREKKEQATEELKTIDEDMNRLSGDWYQELSVLRRILGDKSREISAFNQFGQSAYTFVIMGWIPEADLKKTEDVIFRQFGTKVVVNELRLSQDDLDEAPALYNNPKVAQPFEFLMQLSSPPKYTDIEPTPVIAFFFPLFFGLMVGDIGYGIVIFLFAWTMKRKFTQYDWLQSIMTILMISAVPTIIFGYFYGEFFGNFGEMMGWLHPIHFLGITWNRVEAMIPMLIVAFSIGVVHVFLGLILGIINALSNKKIKHAIEKTGLLVMVTGLIIILVSAAGVLPDYMLSPGIALVIIALPLIIYGGGAMGTIEIMGTVGNILSYARLMAIGMASVILAIVANELGAAIGVAVVGIIVAVLLHTLNIMLAMFSPSLHTIRLHLVECYSKFYEGGGRMYTPFKKNE